LAEYAASQLPAIDWSTVVWWKGEQYAKILEPESRMAEAVTRSVRTERLDPADAKGAYSAARAVLKAHANDIKAEVERASPTLSTPIELAANTLRDIVTVSYYSAAYGMDLHKPENVLPLYQRGVLTEKQIKRDANIRHAIFRALVLLEDYGVYAQLRERSGIQGLGGYRRRGLGADPVVTPIVTQVLVAIAAVAAAAILAWLILAIYDTSKTDDMVEAFCKQAQASGDPHQLEICVGLLGMKRDKYSWVPGVGRGAADAGKPDDLLQAIIKWGAVGLLGYIGVTQLLPRMLAGRRGGGDGEPVTLRISRR
jgi:hypothetical protein